MFIHIRPDETQTIQRIPRALLFPAPGIPKGHVLLGYGCRSYACRIFTATGFPVDRQTQPDIAQRVDSWVFHHESEESRKELSTLREAAAFLQKNRDMFPQGSLPAHPAQLAVLAVKIYKLFDTAATNGSSGMSDRVIAQSIFSANETKSVHGIDPRRTVSKPTGKA
jgi:uncharacterized protein